MIWVNSQELDKFRIIAGIDTFVLSASEKHLASLVGCFFPSDRDDKRYLGPLTLTTLYVKGAP